MNSTFRATPFAVFPVTDIYAVYDIEGKQFKYKVHAIACYINEDGEGFDMYHIDFNNLEDTFHLPGNNLENFLGLIDGESNCIELDPKDYIKKGK